MSDINYRIKQARKIMIEKGIHALIVPSSDPHLSEYVADYWKSREYISGFDGSAGTAVITLDEAGLWTDARYFIQAEKQLANSEFVLHKMENQFSPTFIQWLINTLPTKAKVAVDGWCIAQNEYQKYRDYLDKINGKLVTDLDIIGEIWSDRPPLPLESVFTHKVKYAGRSRLEKFRLLRKKMKEEGASYYLLPALDDIAWTLNLRGRDVDCNPVFIAYFLLGLKDSILFIDLAKVPKKIQLALENDDIHLRPYTDIYSYLNRLSEDIGVWVDKSQINSTLYRAINGKTMAGKSFAKWEKARKNSIEVVHFRNCMEKDGAALAETFYWLESVVDSQRLTEYDVAVKLADNRRKQELYYGESFHAIVGFQANGAIMHYRPTPDNSTEIRSEGMLLVDSGGQYEDGTTDITRTFYLGNPSAEQKKHYTLVLKGLISLSQAVFPEKTSGGQLDTFARQYLWRERLNFAHGTGHGVGFFMNVHEPPQGFANINSERGKTPFDKGMVTSNEPGLYLEGAYGIRLENLILAIPDTENFLKFETLTLYPFAHNLIDKSLLTAEEVNWLNSYHQKVYERIVPWLADENIIAWFEQKCLPI